ncbi:oligosaccharide flippase family protein [Niveibacterium sp. SC-1]|uniref:lipopolysaccharide biosynthesis protein n=1 Tax=Niveibacterium sp. SC-1 TaxID=3135646 RepID=UPI00311DD5BC
MSTLRNIAYVGTGTAVRLGCGILNFVVMPRMLGPEAFSVFMLWFSVAMLIALLTNFGFPTYVLREGSAARERLSRLLGEVVTANLLISLTVLVVSVCALPFIPQEHWPIFLVLLLAKLVDSAGEILSVGYRVTGRFDTEARIAVVTSLCQLPVTIGALYLYRDPLSGAVAFLLVRVSVLVFTIRTLRGYLADIHLGRVKAALGHFRNAWAYAADFGLQNLFGQIDSVVLAQYIGVSAVGVYQAGMRLFVGAAQAVFVLGTVFVPKATAAYTAGQGAERVLKQLQLSFFVVGCAGSMVFVLFAAPITNLLFGHRFAGLAELLPIFGLLFFMRCLSAVWGVALTIIGRQGSRFKLAALHWVLIFAASAYLVPEYGVSGWLYSLILGNVFLAAGYAVTCAASWKGVPVKSGAAIAATYFAILLTVMSAGAFR